MIPISFPLCCRHGSDKKCALFPIVTCIQLFNQTQTLLFHRAKLSKHPTTPGRRSPFQTEQNSNDDHFSSPKNSTNASKSLSIIYRPITNSTISSSVGSAVKENFVSTMTKSASVGTHSNQLVMDDGGDSLDLIIPSKNDYDELVLTLQNLLELYQEEEVCSNPDLALIHYHLVDMGKRIGSDGKPCLVSNSEWVDLCKRWNVPLTKAEASTMYCNHSETLGTGISSDDGLELSEIVQLLNQLRLVALERVSEVVASPRSGTEQNHISVVDPRKRLFQRVTRVKHDGMKTGTSTPNEPGIGGLVNDLHHATFEVISATAFLQFLHEKQKETDMTLDDVKFLFEQLNGHRVSRQLGDAISVMSGKSVTEGVDWEREYITKDAFAKYLVMDVNDVFDPERACPSFRWVHVFALQPSQSYWRVCLLSSRNHF